MTRLILCHERVREQSVRALSLRSGVRDDATYIHDSSQESIVIEEMPCI